MHTLSFDRIGHLMPYEIVEMDVETFEYYFVFNPKRVSIYNNFKDFLAQLAFLNQSIVEVWVDGSFATLKIHPNDMDLVLFIKAEDYEQHEHFLSEQRKVSAALDVYFVKRYEKDHPKYFLTNFDKLDWEYFFGRNRQNFKKGIIKLLVR